MAAHMLQRYGKTPQRFLSPVSVPLFWATRPPLGADGHGVAPPSDRSMAMMALMPSTELMSTDSWPLLTVNSPLVTPHGPPAVGHDCGGARNVTVERVPGHRLVALQREAAQQSGAAHGHRLARLDVYQPDILDPAGRFG